MKLIAWFVAPFFMLAKFLLESEIESGKDASWVILLCVPIAILQITYCYLLIKIIFG